MIYLLLGGLGVWLVLSATKRFTSADPARLSAFVKKSSGLVCLGAALSLLLLGRLAMAVLLGALGFWLLGVSGSLGDPWVLFNKVKRSTAQQRSGLIAFRRDPQTGAVQGLVCEGTYAGRWLDDLSLAECEALYGLCRRDDPPGVPLLEAYLDGRFPGWRTAGEAHADTGRSNWGAASRDSAMTEDEAYQVLGLHKGAPREAIVHAHRSLMQKFHPDHGGSTDLAARVNEAKDVLLRRHS